LVTAVQVEDGRPYAVRADEQWRIDREDVVASRNPVRASPGLTPATFPRQSDYLRTECVAPDLHPTRMIQLLF
jgi:hypothetical protein